MSGASEVRCPKCNRKTSQGAKFCEGCGAALAPSGGGPVRADRLKPSRVVAVAVLVAAFVAGVFAIASVSLREKPGTTREGTGDEAKAPSRPTASDLAKRKEIAERIRGLEQATTQKPKEPAAWLALAEARYEMVQVDPTSADAAIEAADKVLELSPGKLEALRLKGNVFFDVGRAKDAIPAYEAYLKAEPDDPGVRTDLGTMYMENREVDKAIEEYRKVLADHPTFVNAQFNLGHAYHQKGDTQKALEAYQNLKEMPGAGDEVRKRAAEFIRLLQTTTAKGEPQEGESASSEGSAVGVAPAAATKPGGTLKEDVEAVFTTNSVLGPKITKIEWPSDSSVQITLNGVPMAQMPEDHMKKFSERVAAARKAHGVEAPIHVDFLDASGGGIQARLDG